MILLNIGVSGQIAFDSSAEKDVHYLTNSNTQLQYKWTGSEWIKKKKKKKSLTKANTRQAIGL